MLTLFIIQFLSIKFILNRLIESQQNIFFNKMTFKEVLGYFTEKKCYVW